MLAEPEYLATLARYHGWANTRLAEACGRLPDDEYFKTRPAFFRSIHGTLNHILLADRIWQARILDSEPIEAGLETILYEDREDLRQARATEDRKIVALVEGMSAQEIGRALRYRNTAGQSFETPMVWVLAHLFNHGTHHRGQIHDMLSQTSVAPPPLDLMHFIRETAA